MAIIDTSKGVRPCVEELANIVNNKSYLENKHTLLPWYKYESAPQIQSLVPGFNWNGCIIKYEGCGVFSFKGTLNSAWRGSRTSAVDLNEPIFLYEHIYETVDYGTLWYYKFGAAFGCSIITTEETPNLSIGVQPRIRVPLSNGGEYTTYSNISGSKSAQTNILASGFSITKGSLPEGVTPLLERCYIDQFTINWTAINSIPAGTVIDLTNTFYPYFLASYISIEKMKSFFDRYDAYERTKYLLTQTDFLQVLENDKLLDLLYTMSGNRLIVRQSFFYGEYTPITNIYTLAPEGE